MMRRATLAWLVVGAALVAVAFVLRFGAGWMFPLGSRELLRDEAASWLLAQYSLSDLLMHAASEPYPPLYATLLKGWIAVLGDSEAALRSFSAAAGMAVFLTAWRWAHESQGRLGGVVAATLVALSPLAIANSRDTRMYGLETAFAIAAWFLIWRMLLADGWGRRRSVAHGILLAIAVAGEVWSLALGLVLAGMQISFCLGAVLVLRIRLGGRGDLGYKGSAWASAGCAAGLASFLPWLPNLLGVAGNGQAFWTDKPDIASIGGSVRSLLVGSPHLPVDSRLDGVGIVVTLRRCALGRDRPRLASRETQPAGRSSAGFRVAGRIRLRAGDLDRVPDPARVRLALHAAGPHSGPDSCRGGHLSPGRLARVHRRGGDPWPLPACGSPHLVGHLRRGPQARLPRAPCRSDGNRGRELVERLDRERWRCADAGDRGQAGHGGAARGRHYGRRCAKLLPHGLLPASPGRSLERRCRAQSSDGTPARSRSSTDSRSSTRRSP